MLIKHKQGYLTGKTNTSYPISVQPKAFYRVRSNDGIKALGIRLHVSELASGINNYIESTLLYSKHFIEYRLTLMCWISKQFYSTGYHNLCYAINWSLVKFLISSYTLDSIIRIKLLFGSSNEDWKILVWQALAHQ